MHCTTCETPTVPYQSWRKADDVQRQVWTEAGMVRGSGRGLCGSCYNRARRTGTLAEHPRASVPRRDVLEDWEALADARAGLSRLQACELLAPRMGMTPEALERALDRAGVRGTGHTVREQSGRWGVAA